MSRYSLMLDKKWDICLGAGGEIETASGDYAIAQDVANAVRLFTNEAFFDLDRGVPHFDIDLGVVSPAMSVVRARMREAALNVEGVEDVVPELYITNDSRTLSGELKITTDTGTSVTVEV